MSVVVSDINQQIHKLDSSPYRVPLPGELDDISGRTKGDILAL